MKLEVRDGRFQQVISQNALLEKLISGLKWAEGPVWHPYEKHLTFSDVAGDTMYRWSSGDGLTTFRKPSHMANGNTYDHQGHILTCEHATSRISKTDSAGGYSVVVSHFEGKELNSPNDIVVKSDGTIYFTDPAYGRSEFFGVPREQELLFQGVYCLNLENKSLTLLADDFQSPNGLCFSPDENQLFVNDTERAHIRALSIQDDRMTVDSHIWAELEGEGAGHADGMKVNQAGHLFCTGPGGIHVFDGDANCLGVLGMEPMRATNFTWGDDDLQSLFITTAEGSVFRVRLKAPGFGLF